MATAPRERAQPHHQAASPPTPTPQAAVTFNQYYAGGCFKQVADAAPTGGGTTVTFNQYSVSGGAMNQLRLCCASPTLNQYDARGGIWPVLATGAA